MKRFNLFILINCFFIGAYSQSRTEIKANKKFYEFSLHESILLFEEIEQSELLTNSLRNYADAHRYLHQTEKAELLYAYLVNRNDNKPEDIFMYAEMLLMNKKQEEWKIWMDKFHDRLVSDGRGKDFIAKKSQFSQIRDNEGLFKKVKALKVNSEQEDFAPYYSNDKIVFTSSRNSQKMAIKRIWNWTKFPYLNLYEASIGDSLELEEAALISKKVNKKFHEGTASYTKDGKLMVFTRNNYEEKSSDQRIKLKMFYREKNEEGEWSKLKGFEFNNKEYSVGHPSVTPDGKTIYFASDMPGGYGSIDIYKTVKLKDGSWSLPINLGEKINTEGREMFPFVHSDGFLLFASDGHVGLGGLDIFKARIKDEAFENPKNLGYPANDSKDDFAMIINEGQTSGYFSSNRPGGAGSDDIYSFQLNKPVEAPCLFVEGVVTDNFGNILSNTKVVLSSEGRESEEVIVGDNGKYSFCLGENKYILKAIRENYLDGINQFNLTEKSPQPLYVDLILEKPMDDRGKEELVQVSGKIENSIGGEPVPWTQVTIYNEEGEFVQKTIVKEDGTYQVNLPQGDYKIVVGSINSPDGINTITIDNEEKETIAANIYLESPENNSVSNDCVTLSGEVRNKDGEPLPWSEVVLSDTKNQIIQKVVVKEDAKYNFCLWDGFYVLKGKKNGYIDAKKDVLISFENLVSNLVLEKLPEANLLRGVITDVKTNQPIEGVKISVVDMNTGLIKEYITDASGEYIQKNQTNLNDSINYLITLEKEGYFTKTITYSHLITALGATYVINKDLLGLDKKVDTIEEMIVINEIKFDFDKSNIRPDAALELDKIVHIMNKYPKMEVELGSHTDCRGSKWYNEQLSDRRAKSSASYIKSKISNPKRIYGKGYGESRLLNECDCEMDNYLRCSEELHQENRRTEFRIIKSNGSNVINKSNNSF